MNSLIKNKKGDMPWWMITLIVVLCVLIFVLIMNSAVAKSILANIIQTRFPFMRFMPFIFY